MSTNRQPAGTSVGGQWAPGSASEVDDELTSGGSERTLSDEARQALSRRFFDPDEVEGLDAATRPDADPDHVELTGDVLDGKMSRLRTVHEQHDPGATTGAWADIYDRTASDQPIAERVAGYRELTAEVRGHSPRA